MKKVGIILGAISTVLAVCMIFTFQLPPKNAEQIALAEEKSIPVKSETTVKPDNSNVDSPLPHEDTTSTTHPFLSNESITAALLLLCTALVGLVGISRKNKK